MWLTVSQSQNKDDHNLQTVFKYIAGNVREVDDSKVGDLHHRHQMLFADILSSGSVEANDR